MIGNILIKNNRPNEIMYSTEENVLHACKVYSVNVITPPVNSQRHSHAEQEKFTMFLFKNNTLLHKATWCGRYYLRCLHKPLPYAVGIINKFT